MMPTGTTSMSAKVAIGLTSVAIALIVLMSNCDQSLAAPRQPLGEIKFTRCDGSKEPIGKVEISACKGQEDFCLFKVGMNYTATVEFTSPQAYATPRLWLDFGFTAVGVNVCRVEGIKCPLEAGVKQQMTAVIPLNSNWPWNQRGHIAKLTMNNVETPEDGKFYCVEFPAKLKV